MILMRSQLRLQPFGADPRRILIARAMGNKSLIRYVQCEFALFPFQPDVKGVLPGQCFRLETDILNDDPGAHLAPGTNTRAAIVGAALTGLARLARRRFGGVPSAGSTTIRLVTNFFGPCASKSMVVRSMLDSVMTPQPY